MTTAIPLRNRFEAARKGDLERLKIFCQGNPIKIDDFRGNPMGLTMLMEASYHGHLDVVRYLVEDVGADLFVRESIMGGTALSYAERGGKSEVVNYLSKQIDRKRHSLYTPSDYPGGFGVKLQMFSFGPMDFGRRKDVGEKTAGTTGVVTEK